MGKPTPAPGASPTTELAPGANPAAEPRQPAADRRAGAGRPALAFRTRPRLVRRYCYDPKRPHLAGKRKGEKRPTCLPGCAFRKAMPGTRCAHDCTQWTEIGAADVQTELASGFDAAEVALAEWAHVSGAAKP